MGEQEEKHNEALKNALGDRINEMMILGGIATAPEMQGRGYASTLVRLLNAEVSTSIIFILWPRYQNVTCDRRPTLRTARCG